MRLFLGGRAGAGGGLHRPGHRQEERHPGGGQEEDEEGPLLTSTHIYKYLQISTHIYTYLRAGGHRHRVGHDHLRRQPAQRAAGGERDRDLQHPVRERVRLQRGRVSH